jgi:hypothetical protein
MCEYFYNQFLNILTLKLLILFISFIVLKIIFLFIQVLLNIVTKTNSLIYSIIDYTILTKVIYHYY